MISHSLAEFVGVRRWVAPEEGGGGEGLEEAPGYPVVGEDHALGDRLMHLQRLCVSVYISHEARTVCVCVCVCVCRMRLGRCVCVT